MAGSKSLLKDIPVSWIAFWLILPNLAVFLLWPVIGVPMQAGLAMSGILALAFSQMPWRPLRVAGVTLAFLLITTLYICHLFAIPPLNFDLFFQFLKDVRPLRSTEYTVACIALSLVLIAAIYWAPKVPRFTSRLHFLYAALAIGLVVNLDGALASDARRTHGALPEPGLAVDSAVIQTGIAPSDKPDRNVLVIVVESLGVPATTEEKALFAQAWERPEWYDRYKVSHGTNLYFGSTTNGELRELCRDWAHYTDFDFANSDCLPRQFREAGYETTAVHSFVGDLFGRNTWYRQIGFESEVFSPELEKRGAKECPGVFPGACDTDVPAFLLDRLSASKRPQFVYWLTLNTHVPVIADAAMGTDPCTTGPAQWRDAFPALCRMFQLHERLAKRISRMAMSDRLPPTDILIVGDHKPPLFDHASDSRFVPGKVPWIYLRAKLPEGARPSPS